MTESIPSYDRDATVGVGISLAHDLALNEAVAAGANGTGLEDGGGLGGALGILPTPTRLAAFGVYYDVSAKKLDMVDPLVIGPQGTIVCGLAKSIESGTYYCNVTHDLAADTYTAQVENKEPEEEEGKKTVASVKLFTLGDEEFTQHHMGAIVVYDIGAKLTLQKSEESGSIVLDATGDAPKIVVSKGEQSITLDLSQIPSECSGGVFGVKTVTVPRDDGTGDTDLYHVIGCTDIDLSDMGGTTISAGETNALLEISGDKKTGYTLSVPEVTVDAGDTIEAGLGIKVSGDKKKTVQNIGVLSIAFGNNAQAATGTLTISADDDSGIEITGTDFTATDKTNPYSNGTCKIDVKGRGGEELALRDVTVEGNATAVAKVFGSTDFEIAQKKIVAGAGISVSDDGETVTVSAAETASADAFSGSREVLADVDFSSPYLRKRFCTETWESGVLKSSTLGDWQEYHRAVEETVS